MTRKTAFFEGRSWFKFSNLGLALGTNLKFYTSVAKGLKLKFRKFWRLSYRRKTGRGPFCTPFRPILNRVNRESCDRFVVLVERELQKSSIWLINHWKKLREFVLFIKLFVTQRWRFWRIRSNVLRGTESDLAYTIHFMVWKLMVYPVRSSILKNSKFFNW